MYMYAGMHARMYGCMDACSVNVSVHVHVGVDVDVYVHADVYVCVCGIYKHVSTVIL